MQDIEKKISERAYYLWMADGCPEGKADAFWLTAQRELLASSLVTPSTEPCVAATEPATAGNVSAKKAKASSPKKNKRRAA